jgi:hypothetical protein
MQKLLVLQSLWARERRETDGIERTTDESIGMIIGAGFDGFSMSLTDAGRARQVGAAARASGKAVEGQWFPQTVDDLKAGLEIASEIGVHHLDIQPDIRLRRIEDCLPLLEGWQKLSEQVDFPVYVETHRDRMTTDLFFVLDLLDRMPELKLLADLSHFLVGREFATPVSDENSALIHRVLDSSWALHGRVASREQVQIEISYPHHKIWVDLFLDWWAYGFDSWRKRAGANDTLAFTCELGPKPYAITGRDGNDSTDRWEESLIMQRLIRERWATVVAAA